MIPSSHHGSWKGENRLWLEDPRAPERSEGELELGAGSLRYAWQFRGAPQSGAIELSGPPSSLRADWKDSWHARDGMLLHGYLADGVLSLYGTYPAGDGPAWGWRIELDVRDPEHAVMRMFNVEPAGAIVPAVDLRGSR